MGFEMKYVFEPWLATAGVPGWKPLESMSTPRANFASIVIDNMVYVYGGIMGRGEGKESHVPQIVNVLAEKYDPKLNKWESIEIKGAPPLASFGWTPLASGSNSMLILGGTDGDVLQPDAWLIDFKEQKAEL
jgi:N-acetylneuraminic acid mutarotase